MYLDWLSNDRNYYTIDIETDGLEPTIIWCMGWQNIKTQEKGVYTNYAEIREFLSRPNSVYVGHNIVKYDAPALNLLAGSNLRIGQLVDTYILTTLYSPNLRGGHSLEAWGNRIGIAKTDFNDWSRLSPEMIGYCQQDIEVTTQLYKKIVQVLNKIKFSEKSCWIQHHITKIIEQQRKTGFKFDAPRAMALYQDLRQQEEELQTAIRAVFPAERRLVRERNVLTKSGAETALYAKDCIRYDVERQGDTYKAYEDVHFNIGSPDQRVAKLEALGWTTTEKTPTGKPKPTEESLVSFAEESGIKEVALITEWMVINGRANMINTWLNNWDEKDECIHGKLSVADTLRFRHQAPNTANIPAVRVSKEGEVLRDRLGYYTYEARDLWTCRKGRVLVGTDAAGLELRMLAHFINRPEFTEQVLNGDPHQYNADLAGVTRPVAKTLLYAIQYGAQAGKVAKIVGCGLKEAKALREQFLARLGIKGVMDSAINEQQTGRIELVDGSRVACPSPHAALNYKLQGSGARVMALGAILLDRYIQSDGLDSLKVGDIHDEWQYDVAPNDARQHAKRSVQAIREAGEKLNLNIPLDGTAKEGLTWAETH